MIVAIADTHTTIWYLYSDPHLGKAASEFIDSPVAKGDHIGVSAMSIAETI
jgi:PIN domain nuclease of toxin-antitoxin system